MLGSRSTYLRGAFGGLYGRGLQAGDILETINISYSHHELAGRSLPEEARLYYKDHPTVEIILGPQSNTFSEESIATFFLTSFSSASIRIEWATGWEAHR